jgi:hypothetical protein
VGVASYASSPLRNALNDARDVAAALRAAGFAVTLLEDPPLRALLEAVEAFGAALGKDDTALFYFAGHGCQGENGCATARGASTGAACTCPAAPGAGRTHAFISCSRLTLRLRRVGTAARTT